MKALIPILIGLLVVGCGKEVKTSSKKILSPEEKVVGEYRLKDENRYWSLHFLGEEHDWRFWRLWKGSSMPDQFVDKGTWKLVGKEVHVRVELANPIQKKLSEAENVTTVYKIEPNGNLTQVASVPSGKRVAIQKEFQRTFKKRPPMTSPSGPDGSSDP